MNKKENLKTLLENVPGSYSDFVEGGMMEAEDSEEFTDKVISFIESHPTATTSDIIQYETEEIFGIKPIA